MTNNKSYIKNNNEVNVDFDRLSRTEKCLSGRLWGSVMHQHKFLLKIPTEKTIKKYFYYKGAESMVMDAFAAYNNNDKEKIREAKYLKETTEDFFNNKIFP